MLKRIFPEDLRLGMFIDSAVGEKESEDAKMVKFLNNVLVDTPEKLKKIISFKLKYLIINTDKFVEIHELPQMETKIEPSQEEPNIASPAGADQIPESIVPQSETVKPPETFEGPAVIKELKKDEEPKSHVTWKPIRGTQPTDFDREIKQATIIKEHAHNLIKGYMEDVRMGRPLDPEVANTQAKEIVDSLFRNEDALVSLTRLKSFDEYTFTHSVNVAVLVTSFAKKLGFSRLRLERLAVGGICHDLGKAKIPLEVLNKPGRFTPEEREIMKTHPVHSYEILEETEDIHSDSKRIALEHHERLDGNGYPHGKSFHELHIDTNIASICDVYDAMTSARPYKPAMPLPQSIEFLLERAGTEFKRNLLEVFVEHIGAYPVGSLVELMSGELAIVKQLHHEDLTRPYVLIITDKYKKMVEKPAVILLADFESKDKTIARYMDPIQFNMNPNEFLEKHTEVNA